jgi:choline dehydrogenase-like flavoprotein
MSPGPLSQLTPKSDDPIVNADEQNALWDVVIIGAGMGGGMAARSLSEAGFSVLLVEIGYKQLKPVPAGDSVEDVMYEGKWPGPIACEIDGKRTNHFGILGCGVGGSTNLYAAALERFARADLDSLPESVHPTGGWAFSYNQLLPYYETAERLLHVAGTGDPLNSDPVDHLRQPPQLGLADTYFMKSFAQSGMHPYRQHVGIRYLPGCDECLSRLCFRSCRADARSVVAEGRTQPTVLERTEALRFEASRDEILAVTIRQGGQERRVRAKVFVLAAGAVHTPKLLLNSRGEHWPEGLANRSGMVGRNLMFHAVMQFVMWPQKKLESSGPRKSICFRDFYFFEGERLGSVQSSGFEAGYGVILSSLYSIFDRSVFRRARILRHFLRIPAALMVGLFGRGTVFSCCVEDFPYPDNRVETDHNEPDGVLMKYTVRQELRARVLRLRSILKQHLAKRRVLFVPQDVVLNLSHACGTCVMGADAATSVVDSDCRAHGITNLFITDASFMPTSGAINPSLTVAANALRVAERIKQVLNSESIEQIQN